MGNDAAVLEAIAFAGNTLAPFFLEDPRTGGARAAFAAMASLDAPAAAQEWPFTEAEAAEAALRLMVGGLAESGEGNEANGSGEASAADGVGAPDAASEVCEANGAAETDAPAEASADCFAANDALTWEYRRLFVGPAAKAAPPWGSVYTDREQVAFGASTLELRAWMRSHGVARLGGERDPEDHIGLMLALMAWLAQDQPADLDEFLRLHLLPWAGHFLDLMAAAAEHPFYEGLARLTHATLDGIQAARDIQVEYPRFYR